MTGPAAWAWERRRGPAGELHGEGPPAGPVPTIRELEVSRPALVLGSTQPAGSVDAGAAAGAGVEVVRRRSGGGAVLLVPGEHVWIDAWVPAASPWWDDDVGRAPVWFGRAWARALGELGATGVTVHTDGLVRTEWSDRVCFAGVGPGEVLIGARKAVGVSQRRTRDWTRLQAVAHRHWDAAATFGLLADPDAAAAGAAHAESVAGIGGADVVAALARALPTG